jgi:hypothetical protein
MASYQKNSQTQLMNSDQENILFLTSWSYDEPLTHSYLLPNVRIVRKLISPEIKIFVQTLEKKSEPMTWEKQKEIQAIFAAENLIWFPLKYHRFGFRALFAYQLSFLRLLRLVWQNKIRVLHAFAPAAGTAALFLHFFTRKKFIIDSWEPHADSMVETGVWSKNSIAYRILHWSEKKQCEYADALIAASPAMKTFAENNLSPAQGHLFHRPACVDTRVFFPDTSHRIGIRNKMEWAGKTVCACVSKLGGLYLREDVFRIFIAGQKVMGENFHALLISTNPKEEVQALCIASGFPLSQITHITVPHQQVPAWLSACDFAFNPQIAVPSKRFGTPVKDGEYWACGLPIVIMPDISDDSQIVSDENAGVVLESLADQHLADAIHKIKLMLEKEPQIKQRLHQTAIKYRGYHIAEHVYREIYT